MNNDSLNDCEKVFESLYPRVNGVRPLTAGYDTRYDENKELIFQWFKSGWDSADMARSYYKGTPAEAAKECVGND